jgi:hypothetical protein
MSAYCRSTRRRLFSREREHRAIVPARPGNNPALVEHEYVRNGALNLFAAFDTRGTGRVLGILRKRKRQVELIEWLEVIDRTTPASVTLIHVLCDNLSISQRPARPRMARRSPSVSDALHADPLLVDEPD